MNHSDRVGFMQGRLSPLIDGRIQAFPWVYWQDEFALAGKYGMRLMEWTLDQDRLYENPLLTVEGQSTINALCELHGILLPSLTGDCFMQAPFWKAQREEERVALQRDFRAIARACANVGISIMVLPLVDNGRLENRAQEDALVFFLESEAASLVKLGVQVAFESDFNPEDLHRFIQRLDASMFGINYDIGNSAALGFSPAKEFAAYGSRIFNVHVKDRVLGGTTVPLGMGNADFEAVFFELGRLGYSGNYILQTARATDDDHAGALRSYRDNVIGWMSSHGA